MDISSAMENYFISVGAKINQGFVCSFGTLKQAFKRIIKQLVNNTSHVMTRKRLGVKLWCSSKAQVVNLPFRGHLSKRKEISQSLRTLDRIFSRKL